MERPQDPSISPGDRTSAGVPDRSWLPLCAGAGRVLVATLFVLGAAGQVCAEEPAQYRFLFPDVELFPGDTYRYPVEGEHAEPAQGFSFGARYPSQDLVVLEVHFHDTILDAIGTDYFEATIDPVAGSITLGVLVDAEPPFDGTPTRLRARTQANRAGYSARHSSSPLRLAN